MMIWMTLATAVAGGKCEAVGVLTVVDQLDAARVQSDEGEWRQPQRETQRLCAGDRVRTWFDAQAWVFLDNGAEYRLGEDADVAVRADAVLHYGGRITYLLPAAMPGFRVQLADTVDYLSLPGSVMEVDVDGCGSDLQAAVAVSGQDSWRDAGAERDHGITWFREGTPLARIEGGTAAVIQAGEQAPEPLHGHRSEALVERVERIHESDQRAFEAQLSGRTRDATRPGLSDLTVYLHTEVLPDIFLVNDVAWQARWRRRRDQADPRAPRILRAQSLRLPPGVHILTARWGDTTVVRRLMVDDRKRFAVRLPGPEPVAPEEGAEWTPEEIAALVGDVPVHVDDLADVAVTLSSFDLLYVDGQPVDCEPRAFVGADPDYAPVDLFRTVRCELSLAPGRHLLEVYAQRGGGPDKLLATGGLDVRYHEQVEIAHTTKRRLVQTRRRPLAEVRWVDDRQVLPGVGELDAQGRRVDRVFRPYPAPTTDTPSRPPPEGVVPDPVIWELVDALRTIAYREAPLDMARDIVEIDSRFTSCQVALVVNAMPNRAAEVDALMLLGQRIVDPENRWCVLGLYGDGRDRELVDDILSRER